MTETGDWEYGFYRSFAGARLTDAYRVLHPDAPGHSWFGRSGQGVVAVSQHRQVVRSSPCLSRARRGLPWVTITYPWLLSIAEACAQLGMSRTAIYGLLYRGRSPR